MVLLCPYVYFSQPDGMFNNFDNPTYESRPNGDLDNESDAEIKPPSFDELQDDGMCEKKF